MTDGPTKSGRQPHLLRDAFVLVPSIQHDDHDFVTPPQVFAVYPTPEPPVGTQPTDDRGLTGWEHRLTVTESVSPL